LEALSPVNRNKYLTLPISHLFFPFKSYRQLFGIANLQSAILKFFEARAGIEPAHKGFADLSLTTWVPRHNIAD
jgi:hypothetical protein